MDEPRAAQATQVNEDEINAFRSEILEAGRVLYRPMPWRYIDDPYGVLVSEVMLQQTQVSRVMGRWQSFMGKFPTVDALAAAAVSDVLVEWQGMGYNRRALNLKRAAEECSRSYGGNLPGEEAQLLALPGVGPSTAAGVRVFAFNRPATYIETNVRSIFINRFFPNALKVTDKALAPYVQAACPADDPRTWYYALLDVGADLKASLGKVADPARRSAAYARQSAFEGSHRQRRACVLRGLLEAGRLTLAEAGAIVQEAELAAGRPMVDEGEVRTICEELGREGFGCFDGEILTVK